MKIMFVSLVAIEGVESQNIYSDLLSTFVSHGHTVVAVTPREKRTGLPTEIETSQGVVLLHVAIGNVTKNGPIEKGVSLLKLRRDFMKAIDAHLEGFDPDIILYATPPTTIAGLISSLKRRFGAKSYLLLKDIFPQNSVDLGMLGTKGLSSLVYRYFRKSEKDTYRAADYIGCMSDANKKYLLEHEPWLDSSRIEVNPNSIIPRPQHFVSAIDKVRMREGFGIPQEGKLIVYGGNLGKPQAIPVLVEALRLNEKRGLCHFLICGDGTERRVLERYFETESPARVTLLATQPVERFNSLLEMADAGLILLDHRFTIPNYPSRLLSYLQAALPVVAATDSATDIGEIAERNGFGVAGSSESGEELLAACARLLECDLPSMGAAARRFLEKNYSSEISYKTIVRHFSE